MSRFLHRHSAGLLPFVFITLFTISCTGAIATQTASSPFPSTNTESASSRAFVFATDYASSGQVYVATLEDETTSLTNTGLTFLGSSAAIRVFDDVLYILHDGYSAVSNDNLQIVDPNDGYATLGQYSTGNGTNPHDVVVTDGRAFISLYNPSADAENVDASGAPGDVIEMDTQTGTILNRFSFQSALADDDDLNANADQMLLINGVLYVLLQDLDANTFAASSNGIIGMIDVATDSVIGTIPLLGRNPVSLAASDDGTLIAVANMATYDFDTANFNTDAPYGGIELVDVAASESLGLVTDNTLGGYVERVESGSDKFYAVVSNFDATAFTYSSVIVSLPQSESQADGFDVIDSAGTDIRELAIDGDVLWVSRRQINTNTGLSDPQIEALDLVSGEKIGDTLTPAAPGMSMVGF